jgi:hypothetical protein
MAPFVMAGLVLDEPGDPWTRGSSLVKPADDGDRKGSRLIETHANDPGAYDLPVVAWGRSVKDTTLAPGPTTSVGSAL